MSIIALIMAVTAGIALAVQGAANAALAHHVGRLEAAVVSFLGGTLVLLLLSALTGEFPQLSSLGEVPLWQCIYGALLVTAIIYGTPVLGAALTFAAFMFGQLFFGMMVDGLGLFDVSVRVLTVGRIIGCVLLAVGIIAVCYGRMLEKAHAPKTPSSKEVLVTRSYDVMLLAVMFLAGGCSAAQAPTNTALALTVGSVNASLINMFVGLVVTFVAALVRYRGHLASLRYSFGAWKYLGGVFGAVYVMLVVFATPSLGVGIVMGALMLGQLGGGVVLDAYGLMGCPKQTITRWHGMGIVLIALGVIVAALSNAGLL